MVVQHLGQDSIKMGGKSSSASKTTLLDLNDDCLQGIFEYLNPYDLSAAADVCIRLRQNAKANFSRAKFGRFDLPRGLFEITKPLQRKAFARLIRHIGPFMKSLWISYIINLDCIDMLNRYCAGTLSELHLMGFIRMDELTLGKMDEILKCNPQLKIIDLDGDNDRTLQSIFNYVPDVETLRFKTRHPFNQESIKWFGKLRKLQWLELGLLDRDTTCMTSIINEIRVSNIPLKYLQLTHFDVHLTNNQLFDAISKLKTLKTLRLEFVINLSSVHIIDICKHLTSLSQLFLVYCKRNDRLDYSEKMLLGIIQNAEKLQTLAIQGKFTRTKIYIDAATYKKIVKIVEQRREKAHLELVLQPNAFIIAEIPKGCSRSVTVKLTEIRCRTMYRGDPYICKIEDEENPSQLRLWFHNGEQWIVY